MSMPEKEVVCNHANAWFHEMGGRQGGRDKDRDACSDAVVVPAQNRVG